MNNSALTSTVERRALELGFDLFGIGSVHPLSQKFYSRWIKQGLNGDMEYMARGELKRSDLRFLMEDAQCVIVVGMNYNIATEKKDSNVLLGRVARYAIGDDYHDVMIARLNELLNWLKIIGLKLSPPLKVNGKAYVDTGPLLERDVALQAGLGWFGKNTNILNQRIGSYLFLGELIVNIPLERSKPETAHCGSCNRCIKMCPTDAFIAPYVLDARRCISYLTIELKGPIPRDLRPLIGNWIFGCDICQEVCPWNDEAPVTDEPSFQPSRGLPTPDLIELLSLSNDAFQKRFRNSPLRRTKRRGLLRNVCVALGNLKDDRAAPHLVKTLRDHEESLVRGHAAWALGEIGGTFSKEALQSAELNESHPMVLEEIVLARRKCHV